MPAAPVISRYQPSFLRFPIQNARTGFKPVSLPIILVAPGRRNERGTTLPNSEVFDVKYYIVEAPDPAKVAGPFNTGLLVPSLNQFVLQLNNLQLLDVQIDVKYHTITDSSGTTIIPYEEAKEGDLINHITAEGNIQSTIPFYPDADYYDLSAFSIDVEDLPRPYQYLFVWEAKYYKRVERDPVLSSTMGAFCISDEIGLSQYKILINHPGDVHNEMHKRTPPLYFEESNFELQNSKLLEFYRPFADILQDIFDEQTFLNGINHIDRIPAQLVPYLAYLIGWDLPNFPGVTDKVRRSILRHAVRLQKLKGSKRAIYELFEIFGFAIEIINLWFSLDGDRLIAPGEALPSNLVDQEIETETVCQIDPVVADYSTAGFGEFEVPLVYMATGNITINAWLVQDGPTRDSLNQVVEDLTDNPNNLESGCTRNLAGFIIPVPLLAEVPSSDSTVVASSEVYVDFESGKGEGLVSSSVIPVINDIGVEYDKERNILKVNFDHHLPFDEDEPVKVFIFASYPRTKITLPDRLINTRSNRFDVRILLKSGEYPDQNLLESLLQFVFKLKAFHSILRKIIFRIDFFEVYNVQDYCFGDLTQLQTPPSVIPSEEVPEECVPSSANLGYKEEDLALRERIFNGLVEEWRAWKALDGTHQSDPQLESGLNVPINRPEGTNCQFNKYGQDRVYNTPVVDLDHNQDPRERLCEERPPLPDNCFNGRVKGLLDLKPVLILPEIIRCKPCKPGVGSGYYWIYPTNVQSLQRNGFGQYKGQNGTSFLGAKIRQYNKPYPKSLHYTNRPYLINGQLDGDKLLAYRRPSLEVEKDNLGFPSHRFTTMSNLLEDFTHPTWKAKPWDADYTCIRGNYLNAKLVTLDNGDEALSYDVADLTYSGNGLEPDISSFGSHEDKQFVVTHKVYMNAAAGHPAVALDDNVTVTSQEDISFDSSLPFGPIFKSYNQDCNKDYINGYPSEYGRFDVDLASIDFDREGHGTDELSEALGLPTRDVTGLSDGLTALFTCGSQILIGPEDLQYAYYEPFRLDCGCSRFGCGSTGLTGATSSNVQTIDSCILDYFRRPDGTYDYNCDKFEMAPTAILTEKIGACSTPLDGTIPNLLCMLRNTIIDTDIPEEGSFRYKDDYGIIYEGSWVFIDNVLDILWVTKSPSVWGEPDSGYISGLRVFRKGIITTIRQIIRVGEDGSYTILGEGTNQEVDYFQTNVVCGDQPYVDNFCFHLECMVTDKFDYSVICGPRWTSCNDLKVQWPNLATDSNGTVIGIEFPDGTQPFQWVNVWGNDEIITGICPTGTEEFVEISITGEGGPIPAYDDGSGIWPYIIPLYPFVSEAHCDIDRRVLGFVSFELKGLQHTFSGDLHVVLINPIGRAVTVFHRPGSANGNFGNFGDFDGDYKFVEAGYPLLPDFLNIPAGVYSRDPGDWPGTDLIPIGSFDDFVYNRTFGSWRLLIYDWENGDIGSFDSWEVKLLVSCD